MAEATRGQRLSSGVLSSAVSLPWDAPAAARILFAAGWLAVGLAVGLIGESWWWAVAAVLLSIGLLALRSDGECLLWAWDEINGKDRPAPFAGRPRPRLSQDRRVRLRDVSPGDWICDYEDHKIKLDEAEREYQRRREDQMAAWESRRQLRPVTTRTPSARSSGARHPGPEPSDVLRPDVPEILPPIQRSQPAEDWMQVLSIVRTRDGKDAELGLLHRKGLTSPLERWYYHGPGANADGPQPEDATLAELLSLLRSGEDAQRESELAGKLRRSGHSVALIRRALAAAIAVGLAGRGRQPGWKTEVLAGAFGLGEQPGAGHRKCFIKLTANGRAWLEAGDPKPVRRRPKWRLKERCTHCGAPVKAASMFEGDPRCNRCGEFPGGEYLSPGEDEY